MTVAQILPVVLTIVGLSLASTLVLIVAVKVHGGRSARWRLEGWTSSLRGYQQVWATMTRPGFHDDSPAVAALISDVHGCVVAVDGRVHATSGDV